MQGNGSISVSQKCDVPLLVCLSNSTLSAQRSAYFFKTLYGTTFPHTARIHKFMNNQTLPLRAGCRGRQPLHLIAMVCYAAKSLRSLRIYICSGRGWAVQILCSDITFIIVHTFFCFFSLNLHLVGLRRMRLCLKLRK